MNLWTLGYLALPFSAMLALAQTSHQARPSSAAHQSVQNATIKTAQQNIFLTSSVLPECYTYAVERGDPKAGPSVTLSKLASGCKVPWHTHSANAQVLFVSGMFELHMRGQESQVLRSGSYAYVPANHQHQETCLEDCMYYVIREGAADVHYVDETGKEISPQVALTAVGERTASPRAGTHQ